MRKQSPTITALTATKMLENSKIKLNAVQQIGHKLIKQTKQTHHITLKQPVSS